MAKTSNDSRRWFLGATLGGVAVARDALAQQDSPLVVPPWSKTPGRALSDEIYGMPSQFEKSVMRRGRKDYRMPGSGSIMSPLADLRGAITPSGLAYERSHGGIPEIDPAQHRLVIHGLVRQPLMFTMEDIVRFPSVSRIHFLECSGNTSLGWTARQPSVQLSHGLLSACEWTGVLLSTLLDEAGLAPNASWIIAEGADSSGLNRSVPIAKCLDDAMLVYAQNGEALRPENGYPLRLFLPGFEGNMSVKWLRRLRAANAPAMTRWETSTYTDSMPDGSARQFTFVMEAKSVITYPAPEKPLRVKGFVEISGLAWTGNGRIKRVDVSTDGGRSWNRAELQEPVLDRALTRFRFPWHWKGEQAILMSRAIDETGYVQPTHAQLVEVRGTANRYHYNAIQPWQVASDGKVTNVFA